MFIQKHLFLDERCQLSVFSRQLKALKIKSKSLVVRCKLIAEGLNTKTPVFGFRKVTLIKEVLL
jgi:hypothetical protein